MRKRLNYSDSPFLHVRALHALADKKGVSLTSVARKAGMHHTNLTRTPEKMTYATLTKVFKSNGYENYEDFILEWLGHRDQEIRKLSKSIAGLETAVSEIMNGEAARVQKTNIISKSNV